MNAARRFAMVWLLLCTPFALADEGLDLTGVLGAGDSEGFARALGPRTFAFPADHGPHPAFRTEWWYFTGNLHSDQGRRFGYELTLFRYALSPDMPARGSQWAANQIYMGHFALTDIAAGRFHAFERLSRAALGLAGAELAPLRIWVEDWSVSAEADDSWRLQAKHHNLAIDLALTPAKPVILQGDRGLSRKSAAPGNASYYYSIPRLTTHGFVTIDGRRHAVRGLSWMDREWGTSALGADQRGWDWFALQLTDGHDLMYYQLRKRDGSADPHSAGTLIDPQGGAVALSAADVHIEVLDTWRSPRGGDYPARWRVSVNSAGLVLDVQPVLADQELDLSVRYWEGAVEVSGRHNGKPVGGSGYAELTGYGAPLARRP